MPILSPWLNSVVFGERLAIDGEELASDVWEHAIYLGADEFIYEIRVRRDGDEIVFVLEHKKKLIDYFRFVVKRVEVAGGSLDSCDYHHRAIRRLAQIYWGKGSIRLLRLTKRTGSTDD